MGSSHRTLMANKVGTPTGIKPTSPAFQADMLMTAPQLPSDDSTKIAPSLLTPNSGVFFLHHPKFLSAIGHNIYINLQQGEGGLPQLWT